MPEYQVSGWIRFRAWTLRRAVDEPRNVRKDQGAELGAREVAHPEVRDHRRERVVGNLSTVTRDHLKEQIAIFPLLTRYFQRAMFYH